MPTRIGKFEMPKRIVCDASTENANYAKFIAEPFEAGYGTTIGNALRRVLLSSLEGAAITSVNIHGAHHEFCCLKGVIEDVSDIVLNLKKVLIKTTSKEPHVLRLKVKGPGQVTAGDFQSDARFQILNPDQPIASLAKDGVLDLRAEVRVGRGFCPAEWSKDEDQEIGRIAIDAVFSPVRRVNFTVDDTRVGQRIDYDRLELEIWTDGRASPSEALSIAAVVLKHHLDVFTGLETKSSDSDDGSDMSGDDTDRLARILNMSVNEIELSVRAANCLNNANITRVGDLARKTEADLLKYRNFGRKSLNEIKNKVQELGLELGMDFDENLMQPIEELKAPENEGKSGESKETEETGETKSPSTE